MKKEYKVWVSPEFYKERSTVVIIKPRIKIGNSWIDGRKWYIPAIITIKYGTHKLSQKVSTRNKKTK